MAREDSGGRVSPRKSLEAVAVDPGTDRSGGIDQPRKSGEISDEEILRIRRHSEGFFVFSIYH